MNSTCTLEANALPSEYSFKSQALVVGCAASALFLTSYVGNALSVAIPHVATHYGALPQEASYAVSGYTIALACFLLPASLLARYFNNRIVFIVGALTSGVVSVLLPYSPTLVLLVVGRVVQGACASLMLATAMALISSYVANEKRFVAIGIAVCLTYIGVSFSLSTSGFITEAWGYEVMFYGSGIAFLCLGLTSLQIKHKTDDSIESKEEFRVSRGLLLKIVFFVLGIGLTLFSLSALSQRSYAIYLLALGLAVIVSILFADYKKYQEHKRQIEKEQIAGLPSSFNLDKANAQDNAPHQVKPINRAHEILVPIHILLHNKGFTLGFLVSFFSYISVMAEPVLLALFAQLSLGLSASLAGVIVVVQPITIAVVSFFTGRIVKVLGGPLTVTIGLVLQTATLLSFGFIDEHTTVAALIVRQLLVGTGFALFSAPNTTLMTLSVKEEHYALASAMQQLGRSIGQATSYALVTLLLSALISAVPKTPEYAAQFAHASVVILLISGGLGVAAILCAYLSIGANKEATAQKVAKA